MPLGSVRVARPVGPVGSPDGPVHNLTYVTGSGSGPQIAHTRHGKPS